MISHIGHVIIVLLLLSISDQADLKIVSLNGQVGPAPCALTCAGTTGRDSSSWTGGSGNMGIDVDISSCGFISAPIITVSVEGDGGWQSYMVGANAVRSATKDGFRLYLQGQVRTAVQSSANYKPALGGGAAKWNVNWIAAGYTC